MELKCMLMVVRTSVNLAKIDLQIAHELLIRTDYFKAIYLLSFNKRVEPVPIALLSITFPTYSVTHTREIFVI